MTLIAAITERDVAERILTHLRLPLEPEVLSDGHTIAYDTYDGPVAAEIARSLPWLVGDDPRWSWSIE